MHQIRHMSFLIKNSPKIEAEKQEFDWSVMCYLFYHIFQKNNIYNFEISILIKIVKPGCKNKLLTRWINQIKIATLN